MDGRDQFSLDEALSKCTAQPGLSLTLDIPFGYELGELEIETLEGLFSEI